MTDANWWYVKQGQRHGPVSEGDLEARLIAGEISRSTRVWRKGMAGWTRIADLEALQDLLKELPPPVHEDDTYLEVDLPFESGEGQAHTTTIRDKVYAHKPRSFEGDEAFNDAGPWSRFFARWIDYMLYGVLFNILIEFISSNLAQSFALLDPIYIVFISWPSLFLFGLLIEVPIMAAFGSTLGKWIFGIKVRRADGSELAMKEILRRNMSLWLHGLCLGIPIANLFCLVASYRRVKAGAQCRWDEEHGHEVRQKTIGKLRMSVGILIPTLPVLLLFLSSAVMVNLGSELNPTFEEANATLTKKPPRTWTNPITGRLARLQNGWEAAPEPVKGSPNTYWFENPASDSVVLIGREEFFAGDIVDYVEALEANASFGVLQDEKVEIGAEGMRSYLLTYRLNEAGKTYRVDVDVRSTAPTVYWRTVVISPPGDAEARADARSVAETLETTIPQ